MRKFVFPALLVLLTLGITVIAYSSSGLAHARQKTSVCCCRKQSNACPLNKTRPQERDGKSVCCCGNCKGEACPMNKTTGQKTPFKNDRADGKHHKRQCPCDSAKEPAETMPATDLSLR